MKKLTLATIVLAVAAFATAPAFAQAKPDAKVVEACKGKKAGDIVKVDGKDTKCP